MCSVVGQSELGLSEGKSSYSKIGFTLVVKMSATLISLFQDYPDLDNHIIWCR